MKTGKKQLLSVIIPAHNAEKTIERCLNSIILQNYLNFEIIVVVNNSCDRTLEICEGFFKRDNRIKVIYSEDVGVSNARNIGIDASNGDIITFCDADDYYESNVFMDIMNCFEDDCIDAVVFGFNVVYELNNQIEIRNMKKECILDSQKYIENTVTNPYMMGCVWNRFYRRKIIGNIRFDNELTHMEDSHFNCCLASNNIRSLWKVCKIIGYNYIRGNYNTATTQGVNIFNGTKNRYVEAVEKIEKDCTLDFRLKFILGGVKSKLCSHDIIIARQDKESEFYIKRIKESKKIFWKYYLAYLLMKNVSKKDKIKMTISNLIVKD